MAYRVHETLNKRVYIGDEVSKVFNALFDAREARVVSPWIKGQYAEKLMRLVRRVELT
ncbi:hypothetical protein [Vulcanisaeta distributa]|uniref:hypothetical protein n=1 Tax=Vulcanisaeta distributa TaxID=164451 RepID=UPI000A58C88B|nr:hypothetical protein [Vulcanisaeta distributa]